MTMSSDSDAFEFTSDLFPNNPDLLEGPGGLPLGINIAPMVTVEEPLHHEALRCADKKCHAFLNLHCIVEQGSWRCALCGHSNRNEARLQSTVEKPQELRSSVVEYVLPQPQHPAAMSSGPPPRLVFFLVDDGAPSEALHDLYHAVNGMLPAFPSNTYLGLIGFGKCVSVYMLAQAEIAAALTFGTGMPMDDDRASLRAKASLFMAPVHMGSAQLLACFNALQPAPPLPADFATPPPPPTAGRCLGTALEIVREIALGFASSKPLVDIVATVCGPVNLGVGALPPAGSKPAARRDACSELSSLGGRCDACSELSSLGGRCDACSELSSLGGRCDACSELSSLGGRCDACSELSCLGGRCDACSELSCLGGGSMAQQ